MHEVADLGPFQEVERPQPHQGFWTSSTDAFRPRDGTQVPEDLQAHVTDGGG